MVVKMISATIIASVLLDFYPNRNTEHLYVDCMPEMSSKKTSGDRSCLNKLAQSNPNLAFSRFLVIIATILLDARIDTFRIRLFNLQAFRLFEACK
jgi:hypothetical protein